MKEIKTKAYQCDYCGVKDLHLFFIERHELICKSKTLKNTGKINPFIKKVYVNKLNKRLKKQSANISDICG